MFTTNLIFLKNDMFQISSKFPKVLHTIEQSYWQQQLSSAENQPFKIESKFGKWLFVENPLVKMTLGRTKYHYDQTKQSVESRTTKAEQMRNFMT